MKTRLLVASSLVAVSVALGAAQTQIVPPSNKYTPEQDVQLGRDAAAQARQQLPIMNDESVTSYIEGIGRRLVSAIPNELREPEFHYTFEAVNVREINAFALPGGPMFVNRGMIEAAHSEGEVAGVMAHELSHVVLRHGTAQASKATKYELGTIAGAIVGAVIGGRVGSGVAQVTQFGLGTAFLRYGRDYERQADLEGAQIMARAGYDPREMARMFDTIKKQGGAGGPEWLSDHPDPGKRSDYIVAEAAKLRVENPIRDTAGFTRVKSHLASLPKAPSTEQATANAKRGGGGTQPANSGRITERVEAPSSQYTQYNEGDIFSVSVPSNWRELANSGAVTFAPEGAYAETNAGSIFTHGVELGIARNEAHDLQTATGELIAALRQGNPQLGQPSNYRRTSLNGQTALQTSMTNISDATRREEVIQMVTCQMRDGNLFYAIAVAPRDQVSTYQSVFQRVISSIRFAR
ncbi:MAG: M48 family metalloprotease [Vicinamibacterales bacterium]